MKRGGLKKIGKERPWTRWGVMHRASHPKESDLLLPVAWLTRTQARADAKALDEKNRYWTGPDKFYIVRLRFTVQVEP